MTAACIVAAERVITKDSPGWAVLALVRLPTTVGAFKTSDKLKSAAKGQGKAGVKVGIKLGWSGGKFSGGEFSIALAESYSFGEERKGPDGSGERKKGIYVAYEAEEKLLSAKISG